MNDLDYIFAVARIRVKEKNLLRDSDIAQMITMPGETQVLDFLQSHGWGEGSADRDAESILSAEEARTLALMHELQLDPAFLEVLSYPQLFHNMKAGIKEIVTAEPHPRAFYPLEDFGRDTMLKILKEKAFDQLPEPLQPVAPAAFDLMLKTRDGQAVDMLVDKETLNAMERAALKSKDPLFKQYLLDSVAISNIKIAVRAQKMKKSREFIENALADCSAFDKSQLAKAASSGLEDLYAYLEKNGYQEGVESLKASPSAFERWCDNRLIRRLKGEKTHSESVGPVLAFYLARMNEIKTVRIILTAKANGFSEEAIRERVREMYV
ncbi:MAG: V-type ATPase subunit [Firmicutes bacterium]|nr:V-type ATPase subunit [Bacillota bacterium]